MTATLHHVRRAGQYVDCSCGFSWQSETPAGAEIALRDHREAHPERFVVDDEDRGEGHWESDPPVEVEDEGLRQRLKAAEGALAKIALHLEASDGCSECLEIARAIVPTPPGDEGVT